MFNDRDLAVIGSGAVLSIFCLLLPVSFAWKIIIGLGVLVLSMVLALLRLGTHRDQFFCASEQGQVRGPFPPHRLSCASQGS